MTIARFWTIANSHTQIREGGGKPDGGSPPGGNPGNGNGGGGGGPFRGGGGGWGKGGKKGAVTTFTATVSSANVGSDLTDFPLYIDLGNMPASFWTDVREDGGNIRVYSDSGLTTLIPHLIFWLDKVNQVGTLWCKRSLSSSVNTVTYIALTQDTERLAKNDANGALNVFSDYESVFLGGTNVIDWGSGGVFHAQGEPQMLKKVRTSPTLVGHEGVAYDIDNDRYWIWGSNAVREYTDIWGSPTVADSNTDLAGAANAYLGGGSLTDANDGFFDPDTGYLYVALANTGVQQAIARFDPDQPGIPIVDAVDITSETYGASSMCLYRKTGQIATCNTPTSAPITLINKTTFAEEGTISIAGGFNSLNGIEWVPPADTFYLGAITIGEVIQVDEDGRTNTGTFGDAGSSTEGLAWAGGNRFLVTNLTASESVVLQEWEFAPSEFAKMAGGGTTIDLTGTAFWKTGLTNLSTFTLGMTFNIINTGVNAWMVSYAHPSTVDTRSSIARNADNVPDEGNPGLMTAQAYTGGALSVGTAERFNAVVAGTSHSRYRNGAAAGSNTASGSNSTLADFVLGHRDAGVSSVTNTGGHIGFAYLYPGALSADWIAAEYDMLNTPATFVTLA